MVFCQGQLGVGRNEDTASPKVVEIHNVLSVAAGEARRWKFLLLEKAGNFAAFFWLVFFLVQDHSGAICRGEDDNELQPGKFFSCVSYRF